MVNRRELLWLLGHQQTIGMSVVSSSTGCCCRHVLLRHDRAATAAAERLLVGVTSGSVRCWTRCQTTSQFQEFRSPYNPAVHPPTSPMIDPRPLWIPSKISIRARSLILRKKSRTAG